MNTWGDIGVDNTELIHAFVDMGITQEDVQKYGYSPDHDFYPTMVKEGEIEIDTVVRTVLYWKRRDALQDAVRKLLYKTNADVPMVVEAVREVLQEDLDRHTPHMEIELKARCNWKAE